MSSLPWRVITALTLMATAQAGAQGTQTSARRAVVDSLAATLVHIYVDADTGRMIADRLRTRAQAGAYDTLSDPRRFSEALTSDLRVINGDRHLSVSFTAPVLSPATPQGASRSVPPDRSAVARRDHWGLGRVDVLPGNVGYLKVTSFEGSPAAFEATSAALKYLEGTDAMIFDFRGMRGGSAEQSNFLISHFVGADTLPSLVILNRSEGSRETRYTLAKVPGLRRPTIPVWVLTDRGTGSAGEDFAFVLQQLGRAAIVGDRTAGAGHNNRFVDLGAGFRASVSITRVSDARTGKEWERVGVQPTVRVDPSTALETAQLAALDSLIRLEGTSPRPALTTARSIVAAQAQPHTVSPALLASYAGTYEGGRIITVESGRLSYRRDTSPRLAFLPVADDTFILNGEVKVVFERSAAGIMQMVQFLADGSRAAANRIGDAP